MIRKLIFCIFFFCSSYSYGGQSADSDLLILDCNQQHTTIQNIRIIPVPPLYNENGSSVEFLDTGMVDMYVSENSFKVKESELKNLVEKLDDFDNWKKQSLKPDNFPIIGLEDRPSCLVFFYKKKWILLQMCNTYLAFFDVDLILDKKGIKIFTLKSRKSIGLSEDEKIVNFFRALKQK